MKKTIFSTAFFSMLVSMTAGASTYPEKPVKLVVGYAAGGPSDAIARIVGEQLSAKWNVPVIIENRPGATSTIGIGYVANSAADGYTLSVLANDFVASRFIYPSLQYNAEKDIDTLAMLAIAPNVLVTSSSNGFNNYKDFSKALSSSNGQWSYSSTGAASTSHLAAEYYKHKTGYEATHVPYKGFAPSLADLIAGRIDFALASLPSVLGPINSGNLRALAVASPDRSSFLPDTPTFGEEGVSDFQVQTWYALAAPTGLPESLRNKLNTDIQAVLNSEVVQEKISKLGSEAAPMSIEQTQNIINGDLKVVSELMKQIDLK